MKTVKGVWTFKDLLTNDFPSGRQVVTFTSNGESFTGIEACYFEAAPTLALCYRRDYAGELEWHNSMYFFEPFEHSGDYYEIGWDRGYEAYKTIDFGETEQTVSDEFYDWLTRNAFAEKVEITITENGTTTLATAGKYCYRNIDVNVDVPTKADDLGNLLAYTLENLVDDRAITIGYFSQYRNPTLKSLTLKATKTLEESGFRDCPVLETVDLWVAEQIGTNTFRNCSSITKVIIRTPTVCTIGGKVFADSPLIDGNGYVYVPDNLVDAYKTATNWSTFANQIKPISELGE